MDRPPSNGGGGGAQDFITQVERPGDHTEKDIKDATQNNNNGFCAMCSCLWSCCSGPADPASMEMNDSHNNAYNDSTNPNDGSKKAEGSDATLLGSTTNGDEANEPSVSSTDYSTKLLPPLMPKYEGKKCLVLDLDETLVHSSFKPIPKPDFIIPVEIDRVIHHVYVLKRPFVDEFLLRASKHYEIVIFTASLSKVCVSICSYMRICVVSNSMRIHYWINWIFTMLLNTVYFEKVASFMEPHMLKI